MTTVRITIPEAILSLYNSNEIELLEDVIGDYLSSPEVDKDLSLKKAEMITKKSNKLYLSTL